MRARSFFFHYNKPETQRRGEVILSLHFHGACHLVTNVVCKVPTVGRIRKSQPRFVMTGKARHISIENGVATLN